MLQGTTPTYQFKIDFDAEDLKEVYAVFAQNDKCIVVKKKAECTINEKTVEVTMTQKESFLFKENINMQAQLLFLDNNGKKWGTRIKEFPVYKSLYKEVLE